MFDKFSDRHIGVTNPEDLKAMLAVIGVKSVDELIAQVIPQSIRLKQPLALPQGMSEYEFANHIQALAALPTSRRPMKQKKGTGSDALIPSPTLFVFGTFLLVFSVIEYIVTAALF